MDPEPSSNPPTAILIPINNLVVTQPWQIGHVVIHPGADAAQLLGEAPPIDGGAGVWSDIMNEIVTSVKEHSIADVRGVTDIEDAIETLRDALGILRLFQWSRIHVRATTFGLPDEVHWSRLDYIEMSSTNAPGVKFLGQPTGWSFTDEAFEEWSRSETFQFLASAMSQPTPTDGAARAALGARLLARAAAEHRPDLKILGVVAALEAWLLERETSGQTLRLARSVSWFNCGVHDNNLCGRQRPICPYLHLSPDNKRNRKRLNTLRDLGDQYDPWRCSAWHQIMAWYDGRSDVAHGVLDSVSKADADGAVYWVTHYLMLPILDWLRSHPIHPVRDLTVEMDAIADPAGWQNMVAAIDLPAPPPERPT